MHSRNSLLSAVVALLAAPVLARADTTGVEVLARGPIHEAFAQPIEGQPQASPMIAREPPAPIDEQPPDQRPEGDNVQWVPGYWQWDEDRSEFIWISGFWRATPPGRQWVAGYWRKTDDGWQWVPGAWISDKQSELNVQPPPPEMVDPGPATAAPSEDSFYVPGVWVYRDSRYLWRPGYWLAVRAGWVWVPSHYIWTPLGWVFVDGYWDYPLAARGVLFAPVAVDPRVCYRAGWYYTPSYAVSVGFLPGALFVRGGWGHYFFGDYFGGRYLKAGYTPWVDYRIGRAAYDPLYSYYRARNIGRSWDRDVRALYAGRAAGDATLPARTLTQQNTLIRNLQSKNVSVNSIHNVTAVTPLTQLGKNAPTLTRISNTERTQFTRSAVQVRSQSVQRRDVEARILKSDGALRGKDAPRPLKLDTPKATPSPTIRTDPGRPTSPTIRETPTRPTTPRDNGPSNPGPKPVTPSGPGPRPVKPSDPGPKPVKPSDLGPKPVKPSDPGPRPVKPSDPGPRRVKPSDPGPGAPRGTLPSGPAPKVTPPHDPGPRSIQASTPRTPIQVAKKTVSSSPKVLSASTAPRVQPASPPPPRVSPAPSGKTAPSFKPGSGSKPSASTKGSSNRRPHR